METIRNFLDNMFLNRPRTKEIIQAKEELLQMMEDKYTELKEEGKTENEAVGIVISEFGNLEELEETLGIANVSDNMSVDENSNQEYRQVEDKVTKRFLSLDEAKEYLKAAKKKALFVAIGVFLCINSVVAGPILSEIISGAIHYDNVEFADGIGASMMFVFIAIAVGFFIAVGMMMKHYHWIENKEFVTDYETKAYVEEMEKNYRHKHTVHMIFGVMFCILCVVPAALMDAMGLPEWCENISGALLFVFVGIGVFLIVKTSIVQSSFENIILDDAGKYEKKSKRKQDEFASPKIQSLMDLYYPTITCIYLCWSFLTFDWHITWLIWPVSALVKEILKATLKDVEV